jgi:aminoglycoside phosphotransferase (APT) family kinase protein
MVTPEGGQPGILDWEHAHVSDPVEDLGWFCVRAWRFGADDLEAGGLTDRETFLAWYENAGGRAVERARVQWWELFGNVRWGVGALLQARRHLSGADRSVELASLGRICAEMEFEVLRLIEEVDR